MPRFAKGSPEAKAWGEKMRAMRKKKKGEGILGSSLGGIVGGVAGALGGPLGSMAGSHLGSLAGSTLEDKFRGRGVDKAIVGKGAQLSKPMKNAMKNNYEVQLPTVSLKSDSSGKVDGRVRPSSDMMTLSPYQQTTSPAMNPFVPTTYFQEGGQSAGYGEAVPTKRGGGMRSKKNKMMMMMGHGMYGSGLHGGGMYGSGLYTPSEKC
jgi:hypothetical protein